MFRFLMPSRRAPGSNSSRRTGFQPSVEALEDRLVPASAILNGSVLSIVADPGTATAAKTISVQTDATNPAKLDVKENGTLLGQFSIAAINFVNLQMKGNDIVSVNDSNGFPFAAGTEVQLFQLNSNVGSDKLTIVGSRAISGNEVFVAGTPSRDGTLALAGTTFTLNGGVVASVSDEVANTSGSVFVQTVAPSVNVTGTGGVTETISGLAGSNGGNVFTFAGKSTVLLQLRGNSQTATLNATAAAQGLKNFFVQQFAANDTTRINATPGSVTTLIGDSGASDQVDLRANAGAVSIGGNATTTVILGSNDTNLSASVTAGIDAPVSVDIDNGGLFEIADGGNVTTQEHVTLTEFSITGTGLFGLHGSVQYRSDFGVPLTPQIFTGRLANAYTVTTSAPTASYHAAGRFISILDNSTTAGLSVTVDVTAFTDLDLVVQSKDPAVSSLFFAAPPGTEFNPFRLTAPNGFEVMAPPGAAHSTDVSYTGFETAGHS
jgi:hypothetical protein